MNNQPIPELAYPVRDEIRRLVPRPKEFPSCIYPRGATLIGFLRFHGPADNTYSKYFINDDIITCCPMGMLPYAFHPNPTRLEHFGEWPFDDKQIRSFFQWWDSQEDPQFAVDQVWGEP